MNKLVIECPWEIGDKLYALVNPVGRTTLAFDKIVIAMDEMKNRYTNMVAAPIVTLKVVGVHMFNLTQGYPIPIESTIVERVYKVIRNQHDMGIVVLIDETVEEVVRVPSPACLPFHAAFGPLDDKKIREVIYVRALNVDGHFKLLEVLDDQDW